MNDTKEQILKESLKLFLHQGYSNVTMNDILKATGLSKGGFYHYFPSKEDCLEECILYLLSLAGEANYYMEGTFKDFIDAYNPDDMFILEYGTALEILIFLGEAAKHMPKFRDIARSHKIADQKIWAKKIQNALDSGEISSHLPAGELAVLFTSLGNGVALDSIFSDCKVIERQVKKSYNDFYNILKK